LNKEIFNHASLETETTFDDTFDSDKFIKMRLRICHDGKNPNGSHFTVDDMEKAQSSLSNIPILANVIFDKDGQPQFGAHDVEIERSKVNEDEYKFVYKEIPIGMIPESCNAVIEEYNGRNYVYADGYVWRGYSNYAEDIIERDKDIKLSMEIAVDDYSYDVDSKVYNITDYTYKGITFLGNNIGTGMIDAMATTYSAENQERMLTIMQELKEVLETFNQKETERGDNEMNEFTEETTVETAEVTPVETPEVTEPQSDTFDDTADTGVEPVEPTPVVATLSHEEIREGLDKLIERGWSQRVYDTYVEYIQYDEEYNDCHFYRQHYSVNGSEIKLEGEPVEIFITALTAEELELVEANKKAFEEMKVDYAQITDKYNQAVEEIKELSAFKSEVFAKQHESEIAEIFAKWDEKLAGNEDYESLKTQDFSAAEISDVETKCKVIYADATVVFGSTAKKAEKEPIVKFSLNTKETSNKPYGGIVDQYLN
jgi:hypothetical protein